ncbi:(2Fe-2S)-binding protein [Xanthomonas albilineans]|uniref:(2Fe-2S)-binding protein n=1 Tax=Xanthomonas albilineans TaxID=29447 RepID=UPI0005F32DDC|nr:(2Fe-2S)-binding protein [Xanthomonas albilineans]
MSASMLRLQVDGQPVNIADGSSVAAAVAQVTTHFRRSSSGQPRAPLCGMGICGECRVRIDCVSQVRACVTPARDGMQVWTDG